MVGGGGNAGPGYGGSTAGGGGGGFIQSMPGLTNPGGVQTSGPKSIHMPVDGVICKVAVGGVGGDSLFDGPSWNMTAYGGAMGGVSNAGGSGGGGLCPTSFSSPKNPGGAGIPYQGFNGGDSGKAGYAECWDSSYYCNQQCHGGMSGGGGGGAGGAGSGMNPGNGLQSNITGSTFFYGAGGNGGSACNGIHGNSPDGADNYGCGGGRTTTAQGGVVILRYSNILEIQQVSGSLTMSTAAVGNDMVTTFSAGSGDIKLILKPEVVVTSVIDLMRRM